MMVNCLIAIAILHVLGALKHHFVYKDQVLRRMLPFTRIPVVLILGVLLSTPGLAATYVLDPARSTLTFAFSQAGALSEGRFGKFAVTLEVADDTKTPQKLAVVVNIDSVSTDDAERDALLRGVDLFNVIKFPQALFRSSAIRATGNGQYVATGTLSIRGISRPLQVPFTFSNGEMQGQVVINRLDFGVGQGEWQATDSVGNAVTVKFSLRLM
jgi:polyisoprenoid-binding protein YceI